jgi:hypothetical protein
VNPDFAEMLSALRAASADHLIVGAHALGVPRATDDLIYQIGVVPNRIDIMTGVSGLTFEEAWADHIEIVLEGNAVPVQ